MCACVRVIVYKAVKVTQSGWIPLYPGVTLASERRAAYSRFYLSKKT